MDVQKVGISLYALMVQTPAEFLHRTLLRGAFTQDSQAALSDV